MLKISYAGCPGLSPVTSAQFTFEMCATAENCKKTKTHYFKSSSSFKVIDVDTIKKYFTSACYDKQHVCVYLQLFYAKQDNVHMNTESVQCILTV